MEFNRNLRLSIYDGAFYSFMVGIGETYISAYMIAKGYSTVASSLISTVPLLLGGLLQLLSPHFIHKMGSYKKWVTKTSLLQGLSFLILALTANTQLSVYWIFAIVSIYWAGGMSTGPAWNSWMTELVPASIQVKYFSIRSTISSVFVLLGLMTGGFLLHIYSQSSEELLNMFFYLFMISGLCRVASSFLLSLQSETELSRKTIQSQSLKKIFKTTYDSQQKNLLLFVFIFLFGVHFSSCFFNPFMIKELKLNFTQYMILLASSFLAKIFAQSIVHKLIHKITLERVFFISALGIVPLPLAWILNQNYYYLFGMQFLSGFTWGLYEVCIFLTLFSTVSIEKRTAILSMYNLFQTLGIVIGSSLGAVLFHNTDIHAYWNVFIISTGLRFLAIAFFPGFKIPASKLKSIFTIKPYGERLGRGDTPQIILDKKIKLHNESEINKTNQSAS